MNEKPETVKTQDKQNKLKKKRLIVLLVTVGVLLLLVLLNSLDFEKAPDAPESSAPYTPETYSPAFFVTPDYESDIFENEDYVKLDHTISYTFNGQTVSLKNDLKTGAYESYDAPYAEFFVKFFTALAHGFAGSTDKTEGFNAFYNEVYFRTHKTFGKFAPQKVYDIDVLRREETIINTAESEKDTAYIGCTLAIFEVRYKILHNDGTFRRDITGDDVIVQYIHLLEDKGGNLAINSIGYARTLMKSKSDSILTLILPLVWIVLTVVSLVLLFIMKKALFAASAVTAFVTFLVSMSGSLLWQFAVFGILALLSAALLYLRKKKKAAHPEAPADDTAVTDVTDNTDNTDNTDADTDRT